MHFREIDFRRSWLDELFRALTGAIDNVSKRVEEDGFDGLWAREYSETILGIAFIAAQTYIVGTVECGTQFLANPNN